MIIVVNSYKGAKRCLCHLHAFQTLAEWKWLTKHSQGKSSSPVGQLGACISETEGRNIYLRYLFKDLLSNSGMASET